MEILLRLSKFITYSSASCLIIKVNIFSILYSDNSDGSNEPHKIDSHETWNESQGDPDLQQDLTKKMIEKAQEQTIKNKGDLPTNILEMLENFEGVSKITLQLPPSPNTQLHHIMKIDVLHYV